MSHLEQTNLNVQGEAVEGHGTDEGDPGGHRVHDLEVPVIFSSNYLNIFLVIFGAC